jgi:hypothetical protein
MPAIFADGRTIVELKTATGAFDPFAKSSEIDRYLRIPAEDPHRFGSDSGHLVVDPIGHQVRFSPLRASSEVASLPSSAALSAARAASSIFCSSSVI